MFEISNFTSSAGSRDAIDALPNTTRRNQRGQVSTTAVHYRVNCESLLLPDYTPECTPGGENTVQTLLLLGLWVIITMLPLVSDCRFQQVGSGEASKNNKRSALFIPSELDTQTRAA